MTHTAAMQWWSAVLARHVDGDLAQARTLLAEGLAQGLSHPLALPLQRCLAGEARYDDDLLTLLRAGLVMVALPHAEAQTRRFPDEAAVWKLAGLVARSAGRFDVAEGCWRSALTLAPADAEGHFNLANLLRDRGEAAEAQRQYHAALSLDPDHLPSLNNLGLLLDDLGHGAEAADCLRRALRLHPALPELHNNLGQHLARHGDWAQALACHLRAIRLQPSLTWSHDCAALACLQLGRFEPARRHWRRALRLSPRARDMWVSLISLSCRQGRLPEALQTCDEALAHCGGDLTLRGRRADVLFQLGRLDMAESAWRELLAEAPALAPACHGLGLTLVAQGRHDQALPWLNAALMQGGPNANLYNDLGTSYFALDRLADAEAALRQGLALDAAHPHLSGNLANVLRARGDDVAAEACYRQALLLRPDHAEACCNLACLMLESGRREEGERWMNRALQLAPAHAGILASALQYLPYRPGDRRFAALDQLYRQREKLAPPLRARLAFAMGRALEQCEQYERAFEAFAEGNRLRSLMQPWDEAGEAARLAELRTLLTPERLQSFAELASVAPTVPEDGRMPIFIVGLPRSGSSLVEQILVSQGEVFGAGEQRLMGPLLEQALQILRSGPADAEALAALRALGRDYKDQLWRLAPQARCIADKMPGNVFYLGLIHLMLPEARFVHTVRDLRDVCVSCFTVSFHAGHGYCDDLAMLGRHVLRYRQQLEYWRGVLPAGRIHDVCYEDLVADLPGTLAPLLAYLGLAWNEACLQFHRSERTVRTASAMQVRQPLYRSAVGRWRHYQAQLAPLLAILAQRD
ncbi:tetratricopeptide repeat-containing sulfotransferase family protein [Paludibacterium purpuratum]|uniref:tetratricopeptide repeat-containing sulfotransferase family protein n=1 Tax=Paludibacterium purpuratum TaxID=1144873 RepID=UPI001414E43E|nr:tetratricopeptide repeat-containing sulfotransferase family protein [Paludibacterium purpuratum]